MSTPRRSDRITARRNVYTSRGASLASRARGTIHASSPKRRPPPESLIQHMASSHARANWMWNENPISWELSSRCLHAFQDRARALFSLLFSSAYSLALSSAYEMRKQWSQPHHAQPRNRREETSKLKATIKTWKTSMGLLFDRVESSGLPLWYQPRPIHASFHRQRLTNLGRRQLGTAAVEKINLKIHHRADLTPP